jgi:hypothetical protein
VEKERRKFDRLQLPKSARVFAEDEGGQRMGMVKILGRGGMLLQPERRIFVPGTVYPMFLVDPSEGVRREVLCTALYRGPSGVGFEFKNLDPDAAVDVGIK